MEELKKLTDNVEYMFLKRIITGIREKSIGIPDSRTIALAFLQIEPFTSVDDAKSKIQAFTDKYSYFKDLTNYMKTYDEEKRIGQAINRIRKHLKDQDIDSALEVAQKS